MKVDVEQVNSVERLLTVEIPAKEVDKAQDNLYKRLKKTARIKGFRAGKVPRSILEKYYAPQVAAETAENLISETYAQALGEAKLEPMARPDFDFEPPQTGQDFVYKVTMDVRPEFEVPEDKFKGLALKEPDLKVTDEEVDNRVTALAENQAVLVPLEEERPSATGDVVVVNYQSFVGDEPLEGGEADNVEVELGKGQVQEEIEIALVKTKPGDMVEAKVDFDANHQDARMAGQTVTFKLLVKEIKTKKLPELDDDFARSVGPEFESMDALKERIKDEMEKAYQRQKDQAVHTQILDQIRDLGEFDLPKTLVRDEAEEMAKGFKQRLSQSGMDPAMAGLDDEKIIADFMPQAEQKVRAGIVLGQIADQLKVEASEEDLDARIAQIAEQVGQPAQVVKEMYTKNNMMDTLNADVMQEKTLQAIKADAKITMVDPAELAKEAEEKAAQQAADAAKAGDNDQEAPAAAESEKDSE
jgi:trigger factor